MGAMLNRNQNIPIQHNWRDRAVKSRSINKLQASVGRHRNTMTVDNKMIKLEPEIKN